MGDIPFNTLVTIGGVVFTLIAGWYGMKGSLASVANTVKNLREDVVSALSQIKALWEKKDASVEQMAEVTHKLNYMDRDIQELREEAKYQRRKTDA